MLDFHFNKTFSLNKLIADGGIVVEGRDDRTLFRLADDENTGAWFEGDEDEFFEIYGHDAATPIAFYLCEKYDALFLDDDMDYVELDLDYKISNEQMTNSEYNTLKEYYSLLDMLHYLIHKDSNELYVKYKKRLDDVKPKYQAINEKYKLEETKEARRRENYERLQTIRLKQGHKEDEGSGGPDLPF